MVTVLDVKNKMLEKLMAMDVEHMSLADAGQYAMVLRTLSEVADKNYFDEMLRMLHNVSGAKAPENAVLGGIGLGSGGE